MTNKEINEITEILKKGWGDDHESQKAYMQTLAIYKARVNELKTEAELDYLSNLTVFVSQHDLDKLKAHEYRDRRDAFLRVQIGNKETLDRLSSTISAQMDGLKSVLFLAGQEFRTLNLI